MTRQISTGWMFTDQLSVTPSIKLMILTISIVIKQPVSYRLTMRIVLIIIEPKQRTLGQSAINRRRTV